MWNSLILQKLFDQTCSIFYIWGSHINFYIESARSDQCLINQRNVVGCPHHKYFAVLMEPVDLCEKLIDCWSLLFGLPAIWSGTDCIELIYEYNASLFFFPCLFKNVSDSLRPHSPNSLCHYQYLNLTVAIEGLGHFEPLRLFHIGSQLGERQGGVHFSQIPFDEVNCCFLPREYNCLS